MNSLDSIISEMGSICFPFLWILQKTLNSALDILMLQSHVQVCVRWKVILIEALPSEQSR